METKANYLTVGIFVLLLFLAGLGFAIWLAESNWDKKFEHYLLLFDGSVTGLSKDSSVRYNGVRVGNVQSVQLDDRDPSKVRVVIRVEDGTPVRADTVGSLAFQGLTGGRFVELTVGSRSADLPKKQPGDRYPRLKTKASSIDQILEGAPDIMSAVSKVLGQAEKVFSDKNIANVSMMLEEGAYAAGNVRDASAEFADLARDLRTEAGNLTEQANKTLLAVEAFANTAEGTAKSIDPAVQDFRTTAQSVTAVAGRLDQVIEQNSGPLSDFTSSGLGELSSLLTELRSLTGNLNQVVTRIERDPAQFLLGDPQSGYEPEDDR
ncbi:MlaD family protein [Fodinicurvata sediminis]|uniref:MlaD family protein n=1 Tax=Fodinicurvata sediminis TaxID=1121832 RepID=UPI0003B56322|nr:MlaD family protein [Fodinicurvata sediminis]